MTAASLKMLQAQLNLEITRLTRMCFDRYCQNYLNPLYLAGEKRPDGVWENLTIAPAEQIDAEDSALSYIRSYKLPASETYEQLHNTISVILRSEPLYIFAD